MSHLRLPTILVTSGLILMSCDPDTAAKPDPSQPRANLSTSSAPTTCTSTSTESPRPHPGTAPDPGTKTLPDPALMGNCPSPAELMNAKWGRYEFIHSEWNLLGSPGPGSIITNKAAWEALRNNKAFDSAKKLPEWEALPYPNVAVLSVERGLSGCGARRLRGLRVTHLNNTIHFDWSLDLKRSSGRCDLPCAGLFSAFSVVSFENTGGLPISQCHRVHTDCPVRSSVHEI